MAACWAGQRALLDAGAGGNPEADVGPINAADAALKNAQDAAAYLARIEPDTRAGMP